MDIEQTLDQAADLLQSGKPAKAAQLLKRVLQQAPDQAQAHHLYGLALYQERQMVAAIHAVERAIALSPMDPVFWNNLGLIQVTHGQSDKAVESHTKAIELDPHSSMSFFHRGNVYRHLGLADQAITDYEQALVLDPYSVQTMSNLASVLFVKLAFEPARQWLDRALAIAPDDVHALNNLALLDQRTQRLAQAEAGFRKAIALHPQYCEAYVNLGTMLMTSNRYAEAIDVFQQVLKLDPSQPLMLGNLAYCRSMLCDWHQYRSVWNKIHEQVKRGALPCSPIVFLNGSDDVVLAQKLATTYTRFMVPGEGVEAPQTQDRNHRKLRVGYFSTDYREHPVATLIVGVLEQHDRTRFETFGYALTREDGSAMRQRMKGAFDHFIDISEMSDQQVIEMVREQDLDIVVDLNGYTEGCRPLLFKSRLAPLQVCYLGFPGTSGAPYFDYTIADERIIPASAQAYYSESILYLPECFQPNDDSRTLSTDVLTRSQFGLPENQIVFCCFNKLYKLNPEVFESWMQILNAVPESVLWLYTEDELARQNLRRSAAKLGVEPARLVFAGRTEKYDHHLARYRLADLFLDTFPYTAHTTASDAMWAGLPVLTRSGKSLASRVGESLLMTLGMPELVTHSIPEFVNKAVSLAREGDGVNRRGFDRLKSQLQQARSTSSLYNTRQYARWLEQGYLMVHQRASEGLPPITMSVSQQV